MFRMLLLHLVSFMILGFPSGNDDSYLAFQVLLACMKSGAGAVLSDRDVCIIVNATFRVVHRAGSKGQLLQRTARYTMHKLVRVVFSHLPSLEPTTLATGVTPSSMEVSSNSENAIVSRPACGCVLSEILS